MKKQKECTKVEMMNRSRPRPEIRLRSAVFEDKSKYKRSREKSMLHKYMDL